MSGIERRQFLVSEMRIIWILPMALLPGNATAGESPATNRPARLDRMDLLTCHDRDNVVQPVKTVTDWEKHRAEIIAGAETVMGPLPGENKRCPLDLKVEEETDCGSYVRRLVGYASEPNPRVPAYLLIPKNKYQSVDRIVFAASKVYQLYGVPQNLRLDHPDCEHDFPDAARQTAYQLLEEQLR